jgi:hypothetical protein
VLDKVVSDVVDELEREGPVFTSNAVERCVRKRCHTAQDAKIVLESLMRKGLVVSLNRRKFQKLAHTGEVSEMEMTILELQATYDELKGQEEGLEQEAQQLREQARQASREGNKNKALALLKRKKIVDEALTKRLDIGTNVAMVLSGVQTANTNQKVLEVIKTGTASMKNVQINVEDAEEVLEAFSELNADHEEISHVLGAPGRVEASGEEEAELERELMELLKEEEAQKDESARKEQEELEMQLNALKLDPPPKAKQESEDPPVVVQKPTPVAKKELVYE